MKPLQNNFTTPEQSKRLLELGLPADSADCFYATFKREGSEHEYFYNNGNPTIIDLRLGLSVGTFKTQSNIVPCWSVGRLIEIWYNCTNSIYQKRGEAQLVMMQKIGSPIEQLMKLFEQECNYKALDFSKLED